MSYSAAGSGNGVVKSDDGGANFLDPRHLFEGRLDDARVQCGIDCQQQNEDSENKVDVVIVVDVRCVAREVGGA